MIIHFTEDGTTTVLVRALRACNTTTGLHSYSIVVMGQPSELPMIQSSMEACNLQFEVAFAHCSGSEGNLIYMY